MRNQTSGASRRRIAERLVSWALAACAVVAGSCASETPQAKQVVPTITREIPPIFRGTVGSEVTINGIEPTLVSGYGLVVGLRGTGGQPLADNVAATMEREMALQGVSKSADLGPNSPFNGRTPREVLRDPNVGVVVVTAAIPPGMPEGARFDVYVKAMNASSLEGGRLFTMELRIGPAAPFGRVTARKIGAARGAIFINPFAEPGKEETGVNGQIGRILNGGMVTEPLKLDLVMDQASHSRARAIVSAINSRFPEGRGDRGPTARGMSGGSINDGSGGRIAVRVPSAYRNEPGVFVKLLQSVQIDTAFPEEYARQYVAAMQAEPAMAEDLSYCLEALGPKAVPFVREMYDHGEAAPQFMALRAGVGLGDAKAASYLKDLAVSGPESTRAAAVRLLGDAKAGPSVEVALQELLKEGQLTVRVAAYEALARRAERAQFARLLDALASRDPGGPNATTAQLEELATMSLPAGAIQGVSRQTIADKFILDEVPFGDPMVYITQQGRPRIVLFGASPKLEKPLLASAWSDRFTVFAASESDPVRVQYRPPNGSGRAITTDAPEVLRPFIEMLARHASPDDPRPGLDMSYAEVVGVLYSLHKEGATPASFATERDRLLADLLTAAESNEIKDRPETSKDKEELLVFQKPTIKPTPAEIRSKVPQVQPIDPRTIQKGDAEKK